MRGAKFAVVVALAAVPLWGSGCGSERPGEGDSSPRDNVQSTVGRQAEPDDYAAEDAARFAASGHAETTAAESPAEGPSPGKSARGVTQDGADGVYAKPAPRSPARDTPTASGSAPPTTSREASVRGNHAEPEARYRESAPEDSPPTEEWARSTYRARRTRAGTLTAGSYDDHENVGEFGQFVSQTLQNDAGESLPRLAIGQQVLIHVRNGQGQPVADAQVQVRPRHSLSRQPGRTLIDLRTGTDGRTLLLTGRDGAADQYEVTVTPPGGGRPIVQSFDARQGSWQIVLTQAESEMPTGLDLALVIDTTGSMSDELEYLKVEIDDIAAAVHRMFPNVDARFALVVYRDEGDTYVSRTFDFTRSLSDFRNSLAAQRANGGGDYPEAMHVALEQAARLSWRDRDSARVMFLVGDAPPHSRFGARVMAAVDDLRQQNVRVFPVAGSGAKVDAEFVMRGAAFVTLGQYLFLTDHSGVGLPHATPHVSEYAVEHLNRLMLRMISSELAGRRLAPEQILAIERGELNPLQIDPEPIAQQASTVWPPLPQQELKKAVAWLAGDGSWRPPAWLILLVGVLLLGGYEALLGRLRLDARHDTES